MTGTRQQTVLFFGGVIGVIILLIIILSIRLESGSDLEALSESNNLQPYSVLTKEKEEKIVEWINSASMYSLYTIEGSSNEVMVWIDMNDESLNDIEKYTKELADRIVKLYDYDIKVSVTAVQKTDENGLLFAYGTSIFKPGSGQIEFKIIK